MTNLLDLLHGLNFKKTHTIELGSNGFPRFVPVAGAERSEAASIYVWLAESEQSGRAEALYVGKAGKGVFRRNLQHQPSFGNDGTGGKNGAKLIEVLQSPGMKVSVMERVSSTSEIFGVSVSLYAAEEDALCSRIKPMLNRSLFPVVSTQEAPPDAQNHSSTDTYLDISELINRHLKLHHQGTIDDVANQIKTYNLSQCELLIKMLTFVEERLIQPGHASKLVKGYTGQLKGCDEITALGFGRLAEIKFSPNGWVARIFFAESPRLALPLRHLNPSAKDDIEIAGDTFSPLDLAALFISPERYLLLDAMNPKT